MSRHAALPQPFDSEPFLTGAALAAGISEGRLRASDLARPFHGVRVPSSAVGVDAARAYARRMTADQYFSHATAAALHGLPLPHPASTVHVTSVAPARLSRARGVAGHSSINRQTTEVRGLRVSTTVDTWAAMSTELAVRDLVIMGDALVRRKNPMATMEQLATAVRSHRGRRGAKKLAAAFLQVRARTDSVRETILRLSIVDFGLPEPEVNVEIRRADARLIAIADLCYRDFRVIAEYDGEHHRTDQSQYFRDVDRLDELAEDRWRVVRFNKSHISRARLESLRRALLAAGWQPPTDAQR